MPYETYISGHPLFKKYKKNKRNRWKYEPIYRLGLQLKLRVQDFILFEREAYIGDRKGRYTEDINDYIPLGSTHPVNKYHKWHLRYLIEDLLEENNWPYKSLENKVVPIFWNAARYYESNDPKETETEFPSMDFLDLVAKVCEYNDFEDFIQRYFKRPPEITILLLPFASQDELSNKLEDDLEHICRELQQLPEFNLTIKPLEFTRFKEFTHFTEKGAIKSGKDNKSDFVIWGKLLYPKGISLRLKIINPYIEFFGEDFKIKMDVYNSSEFNVEFEVKLRQAILWTTSLRHFYNRDYAASIRSLKRLLETGYEEVELKFRIGVLYDLMEKTEDAKLYYYKTMDQVKMVGARESLHELYDPDFFDEIGSITTDHVMIDGNYINKEKLLDPKILIYEVLMLMIFEIVRVNLALKHRDELPKEVFERVLVKTINQIQPSWLKTKYKDLFGRAYYELGLINEKRLKEPGYIDPEQVYVYYENAALYMGIKDKELHFNCIRFFKKYKRMNRIIQRLSQLMEDDDKVLVMYKNNF